MYIKRICLNRDAIATGEVLEEELKTVESNLTDRFHDEFRQKCDIMDRFSFLNDVFWMMEKNSRELLDSDNIDAFCEYDRRMLNFLNSAYFYKEFVKAFGKYNPSLKALLDDYYENKKYYRFLMEYRNTFTHHSVMPKERDLISGEWLIDIDALIRAERENIDYKKKNGKKQKKEENVTSPFMTLLEEFKQKSKKIEQEYYIESSEVIDQGRSDFNSLHEKVINVIYREFIKDLLQWLVDSIYHDAEGCYWYTFIVDLEKRDIFEPNYFLELYINNLKEVFGAKSEVFESCLTLLKDNGYNYMFEENCTLEEYLEKTVS